jgi:Cu(I)/Ag(I) efflux system membrane fusion protein
MLSDAVSPERILNATVSQIEPLNCGLYQLVKVYITDHKKLLIPGRQIQAHIMAGKHKGLWLPKTAVINLGQHQSVFLMKGNNFIATKIQTGLQSGDKIEICSGIAPNSNIALNASLLTDSDGFIKTNAR